MNQEKPRLDAENEMTIAALRELISELMKERVVHLYCLYDISSACIGQITMGYSLCPEDIGQQIYAATGKKNPELSAFVKKLKEQVK